MFRVFINTFKVSYSENTNSILYLIQRIPFIGKIIPDSLYRETNLKLILGFVCFVINIFYQFFKKSAYLLIMIILPIMFFKEELGISTARTSLFFHLFFILSCVVGSLMNCTLSRLDKISYDMINLMRVDAKKFYLSHIIYTIATTSIFFSLVLFITLGFKNTLVILFTFICFRLLGESIVLFIFKKFKKILSKNQVLSIITILVIPLCAYALVYFNYIIPINFFMNPITIIVFLIITIGAFTFLITSKDYTAYANNLLSKDAIFGQMELVKEAQFADVKIDEKKFDKSNLDSKKFNNRHGYDYLNSIFFHRHRKIAFNAIRNRSVALLLVTLITLIAIMIFPESKAFIADILPRISTFLILIMYFLSTTERICKGMFFNCDISLLRYGYYKESNDILSNFTIRLRKIILYNLIPTLILCFGITIIMIVCTGTKDIFTLIPTFASAIALSCFFSIYHLFMYYIVQPYTKDLTIKSPIFYISNFAIYMIAFNTFGVNIDPKLFAFGIIVITLLFIPVALFTVYRIAPKTFKLK